MAAEDVVQSVYCSFFVGARNGQFVLQHSGEMWRLLVGITVNKLHNQLRRHTAGKRAVHLEQSVPPESRLFDSPEQIMAQEPTPEQAAILADTLEQLFRKLEPERRRILELRLQGYGIGEIAAETRFSRPTVRRVLEQIQRWLERDNSAGIDEQAP